MALGVDIPVPSDSNDTLDDSAIAATSAVARASGMALPAFVRLFRGQTPDDPRPSKHLHHVKVATTSTVADRASRWNDVVNHGVLPQWSPNKPLRQQLRPPNHGSVSLNASAVRRHIVKGVRDGRYLIVHDDLLNQWPEIHISPLGVVEKQSPDGPDIRVINDYSFPDGVSVNDFTQRDDFPTISYNPPGDIARRMHELRRRYPMATILLMLRDVSGAFRHVPIHADAVHMFAFRFDGYVVIDLACGFGWCGSPAFYALAGSIIHDPYESTRPRSLAPLDDSHFVGNVWCDDHTCVEIDTGARRAEADLTLRQSMLSVLGSTAIKERKFTVWSTTGKLSVSCVILLKALCPSLSQNLTRQCASSTRASSEPACLNAHSTRSSASYDTS